MPKAILVLEDGTAVHGNGIGAEGEVFGEFVFNTSMSGYQESFTDPSYAGQILMLTYPLIGNYGFHLKLCESDAVKIRGLVIKEPAFFSTRGRRIAKYLTDAGLIGIWGVDTRALTLKLRYFGTMKAVLVHGARLPEPKALAERLSKMAHPDTQNLVEQVSCKTIIDHRDGHKRKVVLIDCGVKKSIISNLQKLTHVIQVPYNASYDLIRKHRPAGIVVSNGPGNPEHETILRTTVPTIRALIGKYPIFGICLGQQLLGLALGGRTFKLKFGHRGVNHPVKDLKSGKVYITSQNHGYAIDPDRTPADVNFDWVNVNDGTVEGMTHRHLPVFSVQFHPEAAPGPYDTSFLFRKFAEMIDAQAH